MATKKTAASKKPMTKTEQIELLEEIKNLLSKLKGWVKDEVKDESKSNGKIKFSVDVSFENWFPVDPDIKFDAEGISIKDVISTLSSTISAVFIQMSNDKNISHSSSSSERLDMLYELFDKKIKRQQERAEDIA